MQFAGKRAVVTVGLLVLKPPLPLINPALLPLPVGAFSSPNAILLASIFIAPVPYFSTQSTTVIFRPVSASTNGFLTTIIGSWAGLSAVPHPSHLRASSVAGAVIGGAKLSGLFGEKSAILPL